MCSQSPPCSVSQMARLHGSCVITSGARCARYHASGARPTLMPESRSQMDAILLTGTRTASTMSTLQIWITFGTSWGLWTRLRSHPAQWQQQQRQRGHQSGEAARLAVLEQRLVPRLEWDQGTCMVLLCDFRRVLVRCPTNHT